MYGHYPNAGVTPAYFETYNSKIWQFSNQDVMNRISNDANVRITYEERSGRVLNLNKMCT